MTWRIDIDKVPQLKRGRVWCTVCGATQRADSRECLGTGWPKCCGYTMTLDSPAEREAWARAALPAPPSAGETNHGR